MGPFCHCSSARSSGSLVARATRGARWCSLHVAWCSAPPGGFFFLGLPGGGSVAGTIAEMSALFFGPPNQATRCGPVARWPPGPRGAGPCFAGAGKRAQNHARIWIFSKVIFDRMGGAWHHCDHRLALLHRHIVPVYHRPVVSQTMSRHRRLEARIWRTRRF